MEPFKEAPKEEYLPAKHPETPSEVPVPEPPKHNPESVPTTPPPEIIAPNPTLGQTATQHASQMTSPENPKQAIGNIIGEQAPDDVSTFDKMTEKVADIQNPESKQ